ncbi:uncharacterized protein LY89DRAFT_681270 [Mollisia scopiformis]|uniref:Uncharacterized protein n=1 Tax=Mollisia scopiformis TaxID=149040 RepID=A0A194XNU9_MOLSC|nr:uncharacterized protein LY89DRAFT_681270 [Mollisia scopiformis]KUJ21910.1 hypothetical protein LY89DRAFT_681270 [Mollisia scopiformis]
MYTNIWTALITLLVSLLGTVNSQTITITKTNNQTTPSNPETISHSPLCTLPHLFEQYRNSTCTLSSVSSRT